jgi:APA family basic amino acid/polyamine antiporter
MTALLYSRGSAMLVAEHWAPTGNGVSWAAFGIALLAVLWAFDGWHFVSFAAGEVRRPAQTIPASLLLGTALTLVIYVLVNVAYYAVLTPEEIRATDRVAATAVGQAFGSGAAVLISVLIAVSILGAINGIMLGAARVCWAMAKDGLFFRAFARLSPRFHTPVLATIAQGSLAAVYTLIGSFQQLFTSYVFTAWIFYGLAVAGVIVLRRRDPELPRPYRCPWYPVTPLFFLLATTGIVISAFFADLERALIGIGLILAGVPLYHLFRAFDGDRAGVQ